MKRPPTRRIARHRREHDTALPPQLASQVERALAGLMAHLEPVSDDMAQASAVAFALLTAWKALQDADEACTDQAMWGAIRAGMKELWPAVERAADLLQEAAEAEKRPRSGPS